MLMRNIVSFHIFSYALKNNVYAYILRLFHLVHVGNLCKEMSCNDIVMQMLVIVISLNFTQLYNYP